MKKRIISLSVAISLLLAMLPHISITANAESTGSCGDNLSWVFDYKGDFEGILTITGTGNMDNYQYTGELPTYPETPWTSNRGLITEIVIESGVTSVGSCAFAETNVEKVTIPASVIKIGESAFAWCYDLKDVFYSGTEDQWNSINVAQDNECLLNAEIHYAEDEGADRGSEETAAGQGYVPAVLDAIEDTKSYSWGDGYGALYDVDGNGIQELLLIYTANLDPESEYFSIATVCSVYTLSGGNAVPLLEKEYLYYEAGSPWGYVGVVEKDGQIYLATTSSNGSVWGAMVESGGSWALYTLDGVSLTQDTKLEYTCITEDSSVVYNKSSVTINGQDFGYATYEEWEKGIEELFAVFPYDVSWSPQYEQTLTLEDLLEYLKENPIEDTSIPEDDSTFYDASFTSEQDGWCFANATQSFAKEPMSGADDYFIPRERYDDLFGSSYVDATEGLYTEEWGGNCAGMSATAILFFLDKLDWESIDAEYSEDFANPNDFYRTVNLDQKSQSYYPAIGNDTEVTRLIEAYQLYINAINRSRLVENLENTYFAAEPEIGTLQGVTAENEPIVTTNYTYRHIPASEGGTYIASMLEEFQEAYENNIPLYISMKADHFGHGIVSRTDLKPEDMGDGWWRVYVYDPNKPYINESVASTVSGVEAEPKYTFSCNTLVDNGGDIYLELNPSLNQWRYCTSVNSNSPDSYVGSTESGELLWNGVYAENENNEQYHILRPDYFYTINLTNFTMEDYANPHFDSTSAWIPENELAVAVDGDTDCTIYDSAGELVAIVEAGDAFVLTATGGFSSYIGQSEDAGSLGGRLYLPVDVYTVHYSSGNVQFFGSSNVLSFSCDGAAELTVDITLNSLQIVAQEDGIAAVKCANVTSTEECSYVETEGNLVAGESFSITYSDNGRVDASTDSKDGEFQLYQKDTDQEEATATKVIKASSLWWLWIVGGIAFAVVVFAILMKKKGQNV